MQKAAEQSAAFFWGSIRNLKRRNGVSPACLMGLAFDSFRRLPLVLDAERTTENGPSTRGELGPSFHRM
jgi:hypothetical protein